MGTTRNLEADAPMIPVVGIGADGWESLSQKAQNTLHDAPLIHGSPRQLDLIRDHVQAELHPWPSPLVLDGIDFTGSAVIASGDPMFHGIGTTLVKLLGADAVDVIPAPSSVSLACARLGWAVNETPVVSLVTGETGEVVTQADFGQRFLVLGRSAKSAADIATALAHRPGTRLTALMDLGGVGERVVEGDVEKPPIPTSNLCIIAVEPTGPIRPWLTDADLITDGQLTKSPIRETTVCALGPAPGRLLWDIGGGTGSISVEWVRHGGRAVCVEQHESRVAQIRENARGTFDVLHGSAPETLPEGSPDAIFIGGGVTVDGMVDALWPALAPGGRLVANAVTLESEAVLWESRKQLGGEVRRISIERAGTVGSFTVLRPALPVLQWIADKPGGLS